MLVCCGYHFTPAWDEGHLWKEVKQTYKWRWMRYSGLVTRSLSLATNRRAKTNCSVVIFQCCVNTLGDECCNETRDRARPIKIVVAIAHRHYKLNGLTIISMRYVFS